MTMWTKEEIEVLEALFPVLPRKEVARKLGRKIYSVANKAVSLRIKRRKPTDKLTKEYLEREYLQRNKTKEEIAKEVGCSRGSVANYLRKYGLGNKKFKDRDKKGRFVKGHKNWNEGLTKNDDPRLANVSRKMSENSPSTHPEVKKKLSNSLKRYYHRPENLKKLSERIKGVWQDPEFRAKISRARKRMWRNPKYRNKTVRKILKGWHNKPTEPEKTLINIIEKYNLPFTFNGNSGNAIIDGKVPDFVSTNGNKTIIEVFGRVFHDPNESIVEVKHHQTEEGRKNFFGKRGWECLVIWDDELDDEDAVLEKIRGVVYGEVL